MRVSDLADQLGCPFEGDGDHRLSRVAALTDGSSEALGFVRSEKLLVELEASSIGAVIAPPGLDTGCNLAICGEGADKVAAQFLRPAAEPL